MRYPLLFFVLILTPYTGAFAQFIYRLDQTIPVEKGGTKLTNPWAGGINSGQFNKMDLNGDGKEDLVIFERTANKILTYINRGNTWVYQPLYETMFPDAVDQWLLLRDFNCDGKKDIFTHDNLGIAVYVNITSSGGPLRWRRFNSGNPAPGDPAFPLLTIGLSGTTNLQTNSTDIIDITDIDGDGDLDFLDAHFDGVGSLEWHKNMSIENTGKCDSMQLKLITQRWGNFEECNCGEYLYGTNSCAIFGGRTKHAAGKSVLTIDFDNDGDQDLLFSEETCENIYFLENFGTKDSANFTGFTTYPQAHPIVNFQLFPATYFEDVDFDGVPDLIMSSNTYFRSSFTIDYANTVWYYKNKGSGALPDFNFVKTNFLQDQMIDVGDNATPAFMDEDGDGDFDMFIASYNNPGGTSFLTFYENIGTANQPQFNFVTNDYAGISKFNFYNMKIQFSDMNSDGKKDLVFTGTAALTGVTGLYLLANRSQDHLDVSESSPTDTGFTLDVDENVLVVDVNNDGLNDLLVGRSIGALEYWINRGSASGFNYLLQNPTFLQLGTSTSRQNPVATVGDLDLDGKSDLVLSDQTGTVTIFSDFRAEDPNGISTIVYDSAARGYISKNLGGRVWPTIVNIFNSALPSIVTGNELGGIQILKNDNPDRLPVYPVVSILPNPANAKKEFFIRSDRNITAQLYTVFGQKLSGNMLVMGHEDLEVDGSLLPAGVYIVRFVYNNKTFGLRVVIP